MNDEPQQREVFEKEQTVVGVEACVLVLTKMSVANVEETLLDVIEGLLLGRFFV